MIEIIIAAAIALLVTKEIVSDVKEYKEKELEEFLEDYEDYGESDDGVMSSSKDALGDSKSGMYSSKDSKGVIIEEYIGNPLDRPILIWGPPFPIPHQPICPPKVTDVDPPCR